MIHKTILLMLGTVAASAPLAAQSEPTGRSPQELYQRGYAATPMPGQAAADAQSRPAVAALNGQAGAVQADHAAQAEADRAQYAADRAAYMDTLARRNASVDRTDVRWRRQQNAYADAMAAWRAQVAACKAGNGRACDKPAPNPADFY